ncbi:hypothetical protein ACOSP7_026140 [Xanthoceras sorbifolium]
MKKLTKYRNYTTYYYYHQHFKTQNGKHIQLFIHRKPRAKNEGQNCKIISYNITA